MRLAIPPADTRKNLDAIMNHFNQANIRMILAGLKSPYPGGEAHQEEYNAIYSDLSKQYAAILYPDFLGKVHGITGLMQSDGVHRP